MTMDFKLADVFSDNLVLQRDMQVPVWGWASPGSKVELRFSDQTKSSIAGTDGRWELRLDALQASSVPRSLLVDSSIDKQQIIIRNVLVGEVWLCSGQSNMLYNVNSSKNGADESRDANYPLIRLLAVPRQTSELPQARLGAAWQVCSPATVSSFSAVGYFFGRELFQRLQVPVGLINSSWGGSVADAWTSRNGLMSIPELREDIWERHEKDLLNLEPLRAAYADRLRDLEERTRDTGNIGWGKGWADLHGTDAEWKATDIPWCGLQSAEGLFFSGVLWFRKELNLPSAWAGQELRLSLGSCDRSCSIYFNNVPVDGLALAEQLDAQSFSCEYAIPASLPRPGSNVIAVRIHMGMYAEALTGPATSMRLTCPARPDLPPLQLAGAWHYAVEQNYGIKDDILPPTPDIPHHVPSHIFNAMIAPIVPFAIRGTIWYQGEANCERARQYRTLFPMLIQDWRRHWCQGDFPFLFVQLPGFNYKPVQKDPSESSWAELREAQAFALNQPNTGMVVAIDIGEAQNIHPANKQDVGLRLVLPALAKLHGFENLVYSGPIYKSMKIEKKQIRIFFNHVGSGLAVHGKKLEGFSIAGKDRKFAWADARLEGDTVVVSSPQVPRPAAVRYAWADNPLCNLFNSSDLPASPFRTDKWPGITR